MNKANNLNGVGIRERASRIGYASTENVEAADRLRGKIEFHNTSNKNLLRAGAVAIAAFSLVGTYLAEGNGVGPKGNGVGPNNTFISHPRAPHTAKESRYQILKNARETLVKLHWPKFTTSSLQYLGNSMIAKTNVDNCNTDLIVAPDNNGKNPEVSFVMSVRLDPSNKYQEHPTPADSNQSAINVWHDEKYRNIYVPIDSPAALKEEEQNLKPFIPSC